MSAEEYQGQIEARKEWEKRKEEYFNSLKRMDTELLLRELIKIQWLKNNPKP